MRMHSESTRRNQTEVGVLCHNHCIQTKMKTSPLKAARMHINAFQRPLKKWFGMYILCSSNTQNVFDS